MGSSRGGVAVQLARVRAKLRVDYLMALRRGSAPTSRCRSWRRGNQKKEWRSSTSDDWKRLIHRSRKHVKNGFELRNGEAGRSGSLRGPKCDLTTKQYKQRIRFGVGGLSPWLRDGYSMLLTAHLTAQRSPCRSPWPCRWPAGSSASNVSSRYPIPRALVIRSFPSFLRRYPT
jgi:hypothetical protein